MTGQWIAQLTPVMLMICMIIVNHFVNHQKSERKLEIEAARLRSALAAELRVMLDLYQKNLDLIEKKADYLLSTRSSLAVYRGNLGRLTSLLNGSVIEQIVGAFAHNERVEAMVAARSNFKCGITYQFPLAEADFDEWKKMYEQASIAIVSVCRTIEGQNGKLVEPEKSVGGPSTTGRIGRLSLQWSAF